MKTQITLLSLAVLPWVGIAADVTGTWKAEFDSQIGLQVCCSAGLVIHPVRRVSQF